MTRRAKRRNTRSAEPPPVRPRISRWHLLFLVFCTAGVALSADLLRLHVNVHTDPNYRSYCALSAQVNCDTVAASPYAVFLGLPVALWGIFGYLAMGALAFWALTGDRRGRHWTFSVAFGLSLFAAALAVALLVLSKVMINSVCLVCFGTYLVSLGLALTGYLATRRARGEPFGVLMADLRAVRARPLPLAVFVLVGLTAVLVTWGTLPSYWKIQPATAKPGLPSGVTAQGLPWIGAERPVVEIVEYSDYQCPHCLRGHDEMRRLVEAHVDRLRLVHRHYPLDNECNPAIPRAFHPQACLYARMAWCAEQQGRFWTANDYLFANSRRAEPITAAELASAAKIDTERLSACLGDEATRAAIAKDIDDGRALGIRGTPTFVLNGRTYPGRIPPDELDAALAPPGPPGPP